MSRDDGNQPGFIGIHIVGATDGLNLSDNDIRFAGPGAGIVLDDRGGGHKDPSIARNTVKQELPAPAEKRWFETYWVDVLSGFTVALLVIFCGWLGLK